jgi:hypothetical protein
MARQAKCRRCPTQFEKETKRQALCPTCRSLCSHCRTEPRLEYHCFCAGCLRDAVKRHWHKKEKERERSYHGKDREY